MVIVKRWIVFIVVLLVLFSSNAFRVKGTSRYVNASTGGNSGDCSNMSSPCKTITYAISQSSSGDGISIAAGTYDSALGETFPLTINNISLSLWGANYTTTIIDATGSGQNVINVTGDASNQVNIQNLTIKNGLIGISLIGLGGASGRLIVNVTGNYITGNSQHGIYARLTQAIIDKNAIAWNGSGGAYAGIYNYDTRNHITNNAVGWNNASGIWNEYVDSLNYIVNNSISFNYGGSGIVANNSSYPEIANNVITSNGVYGIVAMNSSTPTNSYNDVWANAWANYFGASAGTGSISTDPLYTSWFDAHLLCNSPAINKGNNSANGIPSADGDGNTRIVGGTVDMGAYERQSELFCHLYIPYVVDTTAFRSNVGLSNTNASTANITVYFYKNDGTLDAQRSTTVPQNSYTALNNTIRWVRDLGETSPTGLEGYVKIVADLPINAIGGPIDNTVNDPSVLNVWSTTVNNGFTPIAQKTVAGASGEWKNQIIITNMGTSTANLTLSAWPSGGGTTPTATANITINANAQWSNNDLIAYMGITPPYYGMFSWTTDQQLLLAFRIYSTQGAGGIYPVHSMNNPGYTTLYIPYVVDTADFRSNVGLSNINTSTANITVYFYKNDGTLNAQRSTTVPQNSYTALNNTIRWVRNLGESSPINLQGYVRITSDIPIYAIGGPIDNIVNDPSVMDAWTTTVNNGFTPIAQKTVAGASGEWKNQIIITNMGTSMANLTLSAWPSGGGTTPTATANITIGPNAQWSNNDLIAFMGITPPYYGKFSWTTDQPLLLCFRIYSTQRMGGIYPVHGIV